MLEIYRIQKTKNIQNNVFLLQSENCFMKIHWKYYIWQSFPFNHIPWNLYNSINLTIYLPQDTYVFCWIKKYKKRKCVQNLLQEAVKHSANIQIGVFHISLLSHFQLGKKYITIKSNFIFSMLHSQILGPWNVHTF